MVHRLRSAVIDVSGIVLVNVLKFVITDVHGITRTIATHFEFNCQYTPM